MKYQDLSLAKKQFLKMYMKNPNRSISATFRSLREKQYISFIGDYPILSCLIKTVYSLGLIPSRFQVRYAFNLSEELNDRSKKDKSILLDELFNTAYVQTKSLKNLSQETEIKKLSNISF